MGLKQIFCSFWTEEDRMSRSGDSLKNDILMIFLDFKDLNSSPLISENFNTKTTNVPDLTFWFCSINTYTAPCFNLMPDGCRGYRWIIVYLNTTEPLSSDARLLYALWYRWMKEEFFIKSIERKMDIFIEVKDTVIL